jgi:hypothetical protein
VWEREVREVGGRGFDVEGEGDWDIVASWGEGRTVRGGSVWRWESAGEEESRFRKEREIRKRGKDSQSRAVREIFKAGGQRCSP